MDIVPYHFMTERFTVSGKTVNFLFHLFAEKTSSFLYTQLSLFLQVSDIGDNLDLLRNGSMNCLKEAKNHLMLDEFLTGTRESKRKYLKLRWKKLDGLANRINGPGKIFSELFGDNNARDTFWLDSSSTDQVGRCWICLFKFSLSISLCWLRILFKGFL
jgi:hypothetical protein